MPAFLNGEYLEPEAAQVSVLDRGFLFGDGVYELMPVYGGRPFRLGAHLKRLARSLKEVLIPNPYNAERWTQILAELIERTGGGDLLLYWQVTRGVAPRDHAFPHGIQPTVFGMTNPLPAPTPEQLKSGVKAVTLQDMRWARCDIKAISLLGNVLLRQQAIDAGADEAILLRDGYITEGAASNVFAVFDNVVVTPPNGPALLPGVTRDLVLELVAAENLPYKEAAIHQRELSRAQEIWITSSAKEILPVTVLDNAQVGDGRPRAHWAKIYRSFQDYKVRLRTGEVS
jgi:D-alanine transaminase